MSATIELNHRNHVLTHKDELDGVRVPGKVVVVLDILFATAVRCLMPARRTRASRC